MILTKIIDPWKKKSFLFSTDNSFDWKGTIGVGDILFGLNIAYMLSHIRNSKIIMRSHSSNNTFIKIYSLVIQLSNPKELIVPSACAPKTVVLTKSRNKSAVSIACCGS